MRGWELGELARAAGATLMGNGAGVQVEAVATDSRDLPPGCLFVALRGERFDGHQFVAAAVAAGARAVLVDAAGNPTLGQLGVPRLVVPDTLRALGDLAAHARRVRARPVAAVTGSNGKTTTKELMAAVLGTRGPVHKTEGNLNNLIGTPLTLLRWQPDAWAAVVEMGMNVPGEIARLVEIAQPDVGVVTCVAAAHLEGLGSLEAVARAKSEMYAGLPASATAVLNADDAPLVAAATPLLQRRRVLRFGTAAGCDVRLLDSRPAAPGLAVRLELAGEVVNAELPLIGRHNAMNAAAAAAAGWALGIDRDAIVAGLARVVVPGSRLRILRNVPPGIHILDDTYNANPGSMRAAFLALADVAATARRIAVLGDMFELGPKAPTLHHEVGAAAAAAAVQLVFTLGPNAAQTAAGAQSGGAEGRAFATVEELIQSLASTVRPGDWLLVKGSRGMRMERVVSHFTGASQGEGH